MSKVAQKEFWEVLQKNIPEIYTTWRHGLGLAYVKRIVEDHNGQVYVERKKGREVPS
jgi:two-component system phosphate regulon sensor histidine kinase PhoR